MAGRSTQEGPRLSKTVYRRARAEGDLILAYKKFTNQPTFLLDAASSWDLIRTQP